MYTGSIREVVSDNARGHIQYMYIYMYMCCVALPCLLGVLCCFALFVCLILLASFFLPSHLSFKNMYHVQ